MKRKVTIIALLLICILSSTLVGCGGSGSGGASTTIKFYAFGDTGELRAYKAMVEDFNKTVGKEEGITVAYSPFPESSYTQKITNVAYSKNGPDVFMVPEKQFKKWAAEDYLEPLDSFIEADSEDITEDIWTETVNRYRYNVENNTSNTDDPLYSLPIDSSPTALYYNRTVMEDNGIVVIGVREEDMEKWNKNEIADAYGKKKSDYPELAGVDVPAKGYYRSEDAWHLGDTAWKQVKDSTVLVFNDLIPMNWDEVEDLAMLFTRQDHYNPKSPTLFGFYTEWWFNYGWSVGGDCLEDLSGDGYWTFTLGEWSPNYIVAPGKSYTGLHTGKEYKEGETLQLLDKLAVGKTDTVTEDNMGGFLVNGQKLGNESNPESAIRKEVLDAADAGTLQVLPSTKEAFSRFANLSGMQGVNLNICPYTTDIPAGMSSFGYFMGQNVAMIIEEASNIGTMKTATFDWGVAPLPQYKEYDVDDETVLAKGIESGHSSTVSISIRKASTKKDAAYTFLKYLAGEEGQVIKAKEGFVPNQRSLVETDAYLKENPFMAVFLSAMDSQRAGDWWYMKDTQWINVWADRLNGDVRNGTMSLDVWYNTYIKEANNILEGYRNE